MSKPVRFLAFASFGILSACATQAPDSGASLAMSSGPQCFRVNELRGFRTGPDGLAAIRTSGDRWFELRLSGVCPDFGWISQIGIRPRDTLLLCEGSTEKLIAPFPGHGDNCYVTGVRRIAPGAPLASLEAFVRG